MKYIKTFELLFSYNYKVGDIVVCVDNLTLTKKLTLNKKYKVLNIKNDNDLTYVDIEDMETGVKLGDFFASRFNTEENIIMNKYNL